MRRAPDWPTRLAALFAALGDARPAWGRCDCFTFANDAVRAMTGIDPMAPARGGYRSPMSALRLLKRHGLGSIEDYWTMMLGAPLATPRLAGRGDIVTLDASAFAAREPAPGLAMSGVVSLDGRNVCYLDRRGGLRTVPVGAAVRAWRVG